MDLELYEQYRCKSIDEMILPDRIVNIANKGLLANYVFYSPPGTGKTTLAKIILERDHKDCYITINSKMGVETLRTTVTDFCRSSLLFNEHKLEKVVYFEEFDRASKQLQEELKSFVEEYAGKVRFLATCNNINGFEDAMKSRFTFVDFTPTIDEMKELRRLHLKNINTLLKNDNINIDIQIIKDALSKNYPDIRKTWNNLQFYINSGVQISSNINIDDTLYEMILNKSKYDDIVLYDYIYKNWLERINVAFNQLGRPFIKYIREKYPTKKMCIGSIIVILTDYSDVRLSNAIDPFLTLYSTLIKIRQIL